MNVYQAQNKRDYMEDTKFYKYRKDVIVGAVFDGHGGSYVSTSLVKFFNCYFDFKPNVCMTLTQRARYLQKAIVDMDNRHFAKYGSGSTIIMAINYRRLNTTFLVNVGDSRALIVLKQDARVFKLNRKGEFVRYGFIHSHFVTEDHTIQKDLSFIRAAGGVVEDGRVQGILNMSRAIGDGDVKKKGVVATPDVYIIGNESILSSILLSSDGLFETMSTADVFKLWLSGHGPRQLVLRAIKEGSEDNLTVMTIPRK